MKAAVTEEIGKLTIKDIPAPQPKPNEVVVKVHSCGICGSDIKFYHGEIPIPLPRVQGHEFSGEVVEVGKDVRDINIGDSVAVGKNA